MKAQQLKILTLTALLSMGLAACDDGPAEQMGEELDEAAETISEGGESMENKLDDAVDELK
jgi:hypothetical protein